MRESRASVRGRDAGKGDRRPAGRGDDATASSRKGLSAASVHAVLDRQHEAEEHAHDRHRNDQTWAARAAATGKVSLLDVTRALEALPTTTAVMTAGHEQHRAGMLIQRVMACANEPPMVCVAVRQGHHLASLIRDARCFGVCIIEPTQRLMMRAFAQSVVDPGDERAVERGAEPETDPFDALQVTRLISTAPILTQAVAALDCEVVRHLDLEADCELYIGQVLAVRMPVATAGSIGAAGVPGRTAGGYERERMGA